MSSPTRTTKTKAKTMVIKTMAPVKPKGRVQKKTDVKKLIEQIKKSPKPSSSILSPSKKLKSENILTNPIQPPVPLPKRKSKKTVLRLKEESLSLTSLQPKTMSKTPSRSATPVRRLSPSKVAVIQSKVAAVPNTGMVKKKIDVQKLREKISRVGVGRRGPVLVPRKKVKIVLKRKVIKPISTPKKRTKTKNPILRLDDEKETITTIRRKSYSKL
jgi:ribosomal protein S10